MKYIYDDQERRKHRNLFIQFGLLMKLGLKFMKLLKLSH